MGRNFAIAGPEVLRGTLDLMVLQALGTLGPLDGYGIAVRLRELSGGALSVNAEIFPVLQQLEQRGLVKATWEIADKRKARTYTITSAGRRQLARDKAQWDRTSFMMDILREREERNRELEIAREVQARLFPQDDPAVRGLECSGACRPALEVGGDYYDFIRFSDTRLGLAIGDVSGKGIPAALLMATIRAYLRGRTGSGESDLAALMSSLNRFVCESSEDNRYATFFYAQYDSAARELAYVNGGHNPPLLFTASNETPPVLRLAAGGPVIGFLPDCLYEQGRVRVEAGDLLVAYTDGISEARSPGDVEWCEERLIDSVRRSRAMRPQDLVRTIMADALAHVADAPQHDDMTLLVVRFN